MTQPTGFLVDGYGNPLKNGFYIDAAGVISSITLNSTGQQVVTALSGGSGGSSASPTPLDASQPLPFTSGVAPATGAPSLYLVTSSGVNAVSPKVGAIDSLRNGDIVQYTVGVNQWLRYAGDPGASLAVSGPLTLLSAHSGMNLACTGTPTLTLNTGLAAGYVNPIISGAYALAGTASGNVTDSRASIGTTISSLSNFGGTDLYIQTGGK